MKVLVLGAGVAGVSSAWYLAEAGHEVTVIDRAEGVAMETSFANAGQLSYGYHHAVGCTRYPDQSAEMAV